MVVYSIKRAKLIKKNGLLTKLNSPLAHSISLISQKWFYHKYKVSYQKWINVEKWMKWDLPFHTTWNSKIAIIHNRCILNRLFQKNYNLLTKHTLLHRITIVAVLGLYTPLHMLQCYFQLFCSYQSRSKICLSFNVVFFSSPNH